MKCPTCLKFMSRVLDSSAADPNAVHYCSGCQAYWTPSDAAEKMEPGEEKQAQVNLELSNVSLEMLRVELAIKQEELAQAKLLTAKKIAG